MRLEAGTLVGRILKSRQGTPVAWIKGSRWDGEGWAGLIHTLEGSTGSADGCVESYKKKN